MSKHVKCCFLWCQYLDTGFIHDICHVLGFEIVVGNAEVVLTADLEEKLAIFIILSSFKLPQTHKPYMLFAANSGINVSEQDEQWLLRRDLTEHWVLYTVG